MCLVSLKPMKESLGSRLVLGILVPGRVSCYPLSGIVWKYGSAGALYMYNGNGIYEVQIHDTVLYGLVAMDPTVKSATAKSNQSISG